MSMQVLEERIRALAAPIAADLDLRVVQVRMMGGDQSPTLQMMVEPTGKTSDNKLSATIEQCTSLSRELSVILDVEDVIAGAYSLEVSSTGPERPLVSKDDFAAYCPHRIKVELSFPVEGRRRFEALLNDVEGDELCLTFTDGTKEDIRVSVDNIRKARLAFTSDEMDRYLGLKK